MATINPYSSYVGRKMAAYRIENNGNYNLPTFGDILDDDYDFCNYLLKWQPSSPFLKKMCELWEKNIYFGKAKVRFWAEDVIECFRLGIIEIFVHEKLKENIITASDIAMDENIFNDVINQEYLLSPATYKCLATAFELQNKEDIIFTYIHLKSIFASTNVINRRWMNQYTFQDMKNGKLPVEKILGDK